MSSRPQQHSIAAVSTALFVEYRVLSTARPVESLAGDARLLYLIRRQAHFG